MRHITIGRDRPWSRYLRSASIVRAAISDRKPQGAHLMLDVIMLALGVGFFALSVGYAYACDWL